MAISMRQLFGQQGGAGSVVSLRALLAKLHARSLREAATDVGGSTGVEITGAIGAHYVALGGRSGPLGSPLSTNTPLANGEVAFFEYGILWTGRRPDTVFYADTLMPLLGHPMFVAPARAATILSLIVANHSVAGLDAQRTPASDDLSVLRDAAAERLFLNPIGVSPTSDSLIPLTVDDRENGLKFVVRGPALVRLQDRQLYDIVMRRPDGNHVILSAHAVYATSSTWENFSFAHITDIHVTARADRFHRTLDRLVKAGAASAVTLASFNNFNDNFREFIRYANRLHANGALDFILATGDLVDYLFETGDAHAERGGNFALFKALVRGQHTSSDGRPAEELRVPLFTTLGNHDYRLHPYRLLNKVAITADDLKGEGIFGKVAGEVLDSVLGLFGVDDAGVKVFERTEYGPYNLTRREALALDGESSVDARTGARMVTIDDGMRRRTAYYFREFSRQGSYAINLGGRHRVVMVNTKHDSGITTDLGAVLASYLGFGREDAKKFLAGFVNSEGFSTGDLELVKAALDTTPGLVIVGMHAPPLGHAGKEVSHFFRETEHARAPIADTIHFLMRHHEKRLRPPLTATTVGAVPPSPPIRIRDLSTALLRGWQLDATRFFRKARALDDNIAEGVADASNDFLTLCVGRGVKRRVTLVLCGHNHSNIEYRLRLDPKTGEIEYYFDYYSVNPARYYNSREFEAGAREVAIRVAAGANEPGPLVEFREQRPDDGDVAILRRTVPVNAETLESTSDRAAWWESRSPLIVQTPSLGPIDRNQRGVEQPKDPIDASFQGVRVIEIRADVINAIRTVTLSEIQSVVAATPRLRAVG